MLNKLSQLFSFFKNLDNIRLAVSTVYDSVNSVLDVLRFIEIETNDTKLGKTLQQYLPNTIATLQKVKDIIIKYGKFVGYTPTVEGQDNDKEEFNSQLTRNIKNLDELLK